jgi:eukaryotic-like serine/threonine-protein kinase
MGEAPELAVDGLIGTTLGGFRLVRLLGHGGMAAVFLGERVDADFQQQVAVKLLRRGLYSELEQILFQRERQVLASLSHPNIARLIDGGVNQAGVPYLVIDYVDGMPITDFVRRRNFGLKARLELFVVACNAVAAAHRQLVVHRDIKPSNILVDRDAHLTLLDFGIAKLLDEDGNDDTKTAATILTPGYAAPEQFAGAAISTATDVYALGVVLHELLLGTRPQSQPPERPSSWAAALADTAVADLPCSRATLQTTLRGDLDNILLKAMDSEPERRYASAAELADDIGRYLNRLPVNAHPPSAWYRTRKFVRRHRGSVLTTVLFLVAIFAMLGVSLWQARRAHEQAQRATSVRDFLLSVFSAVEPAGPRLAPPSVVDVVRTSITQAQRSSSLYPTVQVELLEALGNVLRTQGQLKDSVGILDENYHNAIARLGADDAITLSAGLGLAKALTDAGQRPQARTLIDQLLLQKSAGDPDLRARLLAASALLAVDRYERERALQESIAAIQMCVQGCSESTRIDALLVRGYVLAGFQMDAEAISILEQALQAQRAYYSGPHIAIADNEQALSRAYRRRGEFSHAEALARDSLAIVEASVPDPHVRRTNALDALRQVLVDERRFDEAIVLGERIIAMEVATLGPEHPGVATSQNTLGFTYMMDAQFEKAAKHFRTALELSERVPDNLRVSAIYRSNLGVSIGRSGDPAQGMQQISKAIADLRALPEPDFDQLCSALEKLGALQGLTNDFNGAVASYTQALQIYREKLPSAPKAWRVVSLVGLGRAQLALNENEPAMATMREALENETTPADRISPDRIAARAGLALALFRRGSEVEARSLLQLVRSERAAANDRLSPSLQTFVDDVVKAIDGPDAPTGH